MKCCTTNALFGLLLVTIVFSVVSGAPVNFYSNPVYYGNGAFLTYLSVDNDVPQAVGLEFTGSFFHDVPAPTEMIMDGHLMGMGTVFLTVPNELPVYTPFQSADLAHSLGHPYPYNKTHFDIHFFIQNEAVRVNNITLGKGKKVCGSGAVSPDTYCRGVAALPTACCPTSYSNQGLILPGIGGAMTYSLSPERLPATNPNSGPWLGAFSFLTFEGRITGYRMMVSFETWENLLSGVLPKTCKTIKMPSVLPAVGYFPSSYCMYVSGGGNVRLEYNTFIRSITNGCTGPAEANSPCTYVPRAGSAPPTEDFIKYCSCT